VKRPRCVITGNRGGGEESAAGIRASKGSKPIKNWCTLRGAQSLK